MKYKVDDKDVIAIDAAIKIRQYIKGDFTEPETFLSRLVFNVCFNPKERGRAMKIINTIVKESNVRDKADKGCLPK